MHDQPLKPPHTQMSHYLRTGRVLPVEYFENKQFQNAGLRHAIMLYVRFRWGRPNEILVDHYFFSGGTFDLATNGLLSYITRSRVFHAARDRFFEQIKSGSLQEADKFCGRPHEDYIMGRAKFMKRFQKKFSDRKSIDFTREFFSLGNSLIEMDVTANVEVNCINKGVSITGDIHYEINDWFRDAIDIEDAVPGYQEYPGGKAFKIVARWSEPFDLSGRFR